MNSRTQFSMWHFLAALLLIGLLQTFVSAPRAVTVPYSQFKRAVEAGKVKEVSIGSQVISGTYEDPTSTPPQTAEPEEGAPRIFRTVRVDDPDLLKDLREGGVQFAGEYQSPLFQALLGWLVPLVILLAVWRVVSKKTGAMGGVLSFGKSRAKLHAQENLDTSFDGVAGVDEAKEELKEIVDFLGEPRRYQALGARIPKGVLLVGPPGTGKTLLAQAVAGEAGVPFFSLSGSDFVEMFVGVGAARVRDLFAQALRTAPCIIFVDELDALGKARGVGASGGHDEREQTLNQLLAEMDGFDPKKGVIIMAATNRPEILDPALLRAGRFDRHVLVDRPDLRGREAILRIHARRIAVAKGVDLRTIAARTPGMVGADLAKVVNEAALRAARWGKAAADGADFEEAIDRSVAGLEKKQRVMSKEEKERVAYHELGHAVTAESLDHTDPVHKVSIVPRGVAALGYTEQLPTEDRYLMTRSELLDRMTVLLGGRVAEEIVFNEISTGAQNDLQKATEIARRMVTEYGMSERQGPVTFERERAPLFLETGYRPPKEFSEETSREIDEEVRALVEEARENAKSILAPKRPVLDRVAMVLQEREVLEGDELRKWLAETEEREPPGAREAALVGA